eukprot:1155493-Pelagomonas_calceolata.AAC.2
MPFSSSLSGLKLQGSSAPSAGTVLVWSGAAVAGYCLYEQLRFKWSKRCKDGKSLPGEEALNVNHFAKHGMPNNWEVCTQGDGGFRKAYLVEKLCGAAVILTAHLKQLYCSHACVCVCARAHECTGDRGK